MRILFATPVPPVAMKPRPHYFIRELAARGHEIHLLTMVPSRDTARRLNDQPGWQDVVGACSSTTVTIMTRAESLRRCLTGLPSKSPLRVSYCASPKLQDCALRLTKQQRIDLLHVDRERLAPAFAAVPIPKVLDATDCMTLYLKRTMAHGSFPDRLVAGVELLKMPRYERTMGRGYAACLVASEEDARALRAGGCAYSVEVVPNGVDERLLRSDPGGETKSLVFVGNMFYAPNVDAIRWFARSIYPRVTEADPEARLYVVGNAPNRSVRRLGRRPGIEVTGAVPSVAPWLQRATVAVVPIRIGGGFPNKVAEAMAAGIPVVSTSAGYRGIPNISPGTHLLEGDDADTFVHETIRLLKDAGLRRRIAAAGRELIQAQGRWSTSVTRLEELYLSMRERHAVPYRAGH